MWENMPYGFMDGSWTQGGHWLGFGLHGLIWLLLIGAVMITVIWAVRAAPARQTADGEAREILDARYARGEIEREEYLARKRDLRTRG